MSFQNGTRWVPSANGAMRLETATGTTLLTVSAVGAVTYGAAVTVQAMTVPSMTETERDALTPSAGGLILNTSTSKLNFYDGSAWAAVTSA